MNDPELAFWRRVVDLLADALRPHDPQAAAVLITMAMIQATNEARDSRRANADI